MSRVGQSPVEIPEGVDVRIENGAMTVTGRLGELTMDIDRSVEIESGDGAVHVRPAGSGKRARAMWGTTRSLVKNLVVGVSQGFEKKLQIFGVGYRAQLQGRELVLQLGYSHEIRYPVPDGIAIETPSQTEITVSGIDRQKIGQVAAEIRSFRKPEPYKGKGVRYAGEHILRKEGKKK